MSLGASLLATTQAAPNSLLATSYSGSVNRFGHDIKAREAVHDSASKAAEATSHDSNNKLLSTIMDVYVSTRKANDDAFAAQYKNAYGEVVSGAFQGLSSNGVAFKFGSVNTVYGTLADGTQSDAKSILDSPLVEEASTATGTAS